jgi:hypothetical protein
LNLERLVKRRHALVLVLLQALRREERSQGKERQIESECFPPLASHRKRLRVDALASQRGWFREKAKVGEHSEKVSLGELSEQAKPTTHTQEVTYGTEHGNRLYRYPHLTARQTNLGVSLLECGDGHCVVLALLLQRVRESRLGLGLQGQPVLRTGRASVRTWKLGSG